MLLLLVVVRPIFLRWYHCLPLSDESNAEDSCMAYLSDIHSLKRHELDSRYNPLLARLNPWQLASQYYNDPSSFKPVFTAYPPNLHSALAVKIDCSLDAVLHLGPISPENAKDKFSKMRVETNNCCNE